MKILLVYPRYPDTFWSFRHALSFISKSAAFPPLGLLTIAAFLPKKWEKRLVDMNMDRLKTRDISWADYVLVSAMVVQKDSLMHVVKKCKKLGKKVVVGGPHFSSGYSEYEKFVQTFVIGESEDIMPRLVKDLEKGTPKRIYKSKIRPMMSKVPVPDWSLIDVDRYASLSIQYTRGCPFNCDFCDITRIYGRVQRCKDKGQIIKELNMLYNIGWRGQVFFVDDNFIGNQYKLKKEILPAIISWMEKKEHPFSFNTEASINLADDSELMKLMVEAGFSTVFIGIETPSEESLAECGKFQNTNRSLISSVKKIQESGLQVQGGFIVGFDNDSPSIFQRQINFIQKSGVVVAMVGLLNAIQGTRLYQRLKKEGRILSKPTGCNTDFSINFKPKMKMEKLVEGYKKIVNTIYSPKEYYERVKNYLKVRDKFYNSKRKAQISMSHLKALFKSIWILGIRERARRYYWKLFFWALLTRPKVFPSALTFAIYGYHFRKTFELN
ncbi:B12-binding domain-containing radical SAM protein [Candidatus Dojkabacteria bacterium]|nr:B12-binding domain-containing radical SAM protein [Candidatus Dojkabacteria bacterium]